MYTDNNCTIVIRHIITLYCTYYLHYEDDDFSLKKIIIYSNIYTKPDLISPGRTTASVYLY